MENTVLFTTLSLTDLEKIIQDAVEKALSKKNSENELIESAEVLKLCKISITTLQKWRDNNKIPFANMDGKILYKKGDVLAAIWQRNNLLKR